MSQEEVSSSSFSFYFQEGLTSPPGGYAILINDSADTGYLVCGSQDEPNVYMIMILPTSRLVRSRFKQRSDAANRLLKSRFASVT
jgi:hypothetical protein